MQTKNILVLIVVLAITITGWWIYKNEKTVSITSFDECVAAGNPILESYPEQCRTADGQTFTRPVEDTPDISNFIRVSSPQPMGAIKSPLKITGEARGTWFFEASFPVVLQDDNGKILAQGIATAQTDWMTEDFVPFETELTFEQPETGSGKLILKKDNPSGLPENDNELAIPVQFTIWREPPTAKNCVISGCSAQICGDIEMASTCEYRPQYACYKGAKCARNQAGKCAWVETPTLKACLADNN